MKKVLDKVREILGLKHNSQYVKDYLNEANIRSSIYMSAVIVILEVWMILRYIIEGDVADAVKANNNNLFLGMFKTTQTFWLLLSLGITMFAYAIFYLYKKKSKVPFIVVIICAVITLIFTALMPFETFRSIKDANGNVDGFPLTKNLLLVAYYVSIMLFALCIICASTYKIKSNKKTWVSSLLVITFFALTCLVFGIRVSFSDYFNSAQQKQIICFLMMSIYIGCLLIWKPYVSLGILGTVFLGFYFLLKAFETHRPLFDGDVVNYITFFISLLLICVSIYDQRVKEAQKDEELEILATEDTLTGLLSFEYFISVTKRSIGHDRLKVQEWVYLFLDITNFKIFNDQRGFEEGNKFLHETAIILNETFPNSSITRQSDDHFVVFTRNEGILEKIKEANQKIGKLDLDIRPGIKAGAYVFRDKEEDPHQSVEKARYACAFLKRDAAHNYLEYDSVMHDNYRLVQYIVRHIEDAVEKERIIPFYQPVVWAKDGTLCSLEVLARWDDERFGFLPPNKFVPALEAAQLVHKLDIAVLEIVCKNLKHCILNDLPVIPVSINFSRMDFVLVNIVDTIESIVNKYKVPHDLIHIEITESALMENPDALKTAIRRFHEKGFSVWLDDFGSGYSSLNALKEFEFDVLKLDMEFLTGFSGNEKAKPLIKSAISLANLIGMTTVCEGVETKDQAEFLKTVNCDRLQGYHYGKPIPYEQIEQRIAKKELILSKDIKKGSKISLK